MIDLNFFRIIIFAIMRNGTRNGVRINTRNAYCFFGIIVMWMLLAGILGYSSWCNRTLQAYQYSIMHRVVHYDDDGGGGEEGEGTRFASDPKEAPQQLPAPQPSPPSLAQLETPRLCRSWSSQACRYLNRTRLALRHWRQERHQRRNVKRDLALCGYIDQDREPVPPVRLALRGTHFRSWWGHVMPEIVKSAEASCAVPCRIQGVSVQKAHVVVDSVAPAGPLPNPSEQVLALVALENGGRAGTHAPQTLAKVDLLASWIRDGSDVPINYMYAWQNLCEHMGRNLESCASPVPTQQELEKKQLAAAFVSNCDAKDRLAFMRELFSHLKEAGRPADSWGKCLHSKHLPKSDVRVQGIGKRIRSKARPAPGSGADAQRGIRKIALLETRYKFVFAFENSIRHDYVTEKALQPLLASVVVVVWGAPQACAFLPGPIHQGGCINALDFATPADLAQHLLALDQNHTAYLQHFAWRRDQGGPGPSPRFVAMQPYSFTQLGAESWPCRLCHAYRDHYC